ncbi:MAG: DNA-binding response regulator [Chloroflexi bacterium]|nr:MAG: DNA-binding response regulator [Chloroflexota bacterium]RLC83046.1 MAG: DNA-binding response regulator [Chloroflexota bacterium]
MKVLVVDDEPDMLKVITWSLNFQEPDWEVLTASEGEQALELVAQENPDIVLLDVAMPEMDGFEVLQEIRRFSDVPVIMVTVREGELDKVRGLELGADDYVTKPFGHLELLARIRAVLRRTQSWPLAHEEPFVCDDLRVDFVTREVTVAGRPVALTNTEYRLLYHLVRNAGRVLTHETLLTRVWGREYVDEIDYLRVYIGRLRSKLEPDPSRPRYIFTERGVGYRFRRP